MRQALIGSLFAAIVAAACTVGACGDASDASSLTGRRSGAPGSSGAGGGDGNGDASTSGSSGTSPTSSSGGPPAGAGIPCNVQATLAAKCVACHSNPPTPGALSPTVTIADMLATSKEDPTKNVAQLSLARMQNASSPMPPTSYGNAATPTEVAAFQAWIDGNYQGSCVDAGVPPASLTCTSCHGDAARVAIAGADANLKSAPPTGTKGETATTTRAVGAHQAHLNKGSVSNPIACTECHVVPTATNHSNGAVGVTFGTLAKTGNKTPTWSGSTCSASYCHGNFTGGAVAAAPAWTGAAMTCTSCHGGPPATGDHMRNDHQVACSTCHGTGYSATTVNKALHVNGVKNAGGAGSTITYNPATRACTPQCHGTETW